MEHAESQEMNYGDALRIHAICADLGMTENDARLFTYMHAKASEKKEGIEYFYKPSPEDSEALEIMLGLKKVAIDLTGIARLDSDGYEALELIRTIAAKIADIDTVLARECGLENRLSGELRMRLRLYKDGAFRNRMVSIYSRLIFPGISKYDKNRIDRAFEKRRREQEKLDRELMFLTGSRYLPTE